MAAPTNPLGVTAVSSYLDAIGKVSANFAANATPMGRQYQGFSHLLDAARSPIGSPQAGNAWAQAKEDIGMASPLGTADWFAKAFQGIYR